jgi:hypothetical protein
VIIPPIPPPWPPDDPEKMLMVMAGILKRMAEGKTANEDGDAGEYRVEEVEGAYCTDANEVEKSAFHAQVGEGLMQALEDSICAMPLLWFVWHNSLV